MLKSIIILLSAILCLSGCVQRSSPPEDHLYDTDFSDIKTNIKTSETTAENSDIDRSIVKALPDNFPEIYREAEAVYALFTGYRADIYTTGTFTEYGVRYRTVDINGYTTLAQLRRLCEKYFAVELTEELMSEKVAGNHPLFVERKNELYRFDGYAALTVYDPNAGKDYNFSLESYNTGKYVVRVNTTISVNDKKVPVETSCTYIVTAENELRFISFELMTEAIFEIMESIPITDDEANPEPAVPKPSKSRLCSVHIHEYHSYPGELIDFIGEEFYDWVYGEESKPDSDPTDDCPYSHCNIIACLRYFDISEEEFTEVYYTSLYYHYPYNPKIMYNGTPAEIQKLFLDDKTGEESPESIERSKICSAKVYLRSELAEMEVDENIIEKYQQLPLTVWTLPELLREAQISRSVFKKFLTEHPQFSKAFDLDAIYEEVNTPDTDIPTEPLLDRCIAVVEYEKKFLSGE